jgi:hypothetical protein
MRRPHPGLLKERPPKKPFSTRHEGILKQSSAIPTSLKQRGSVMWTLIISLVYDQSCRKYLAEVVQHQHRWL